MKIRFEILISIVSTFIAVFALYFSYQSSERTREQLDFRIEKVSLDGEGYPLKINISGFLVNVSDVGVGVKRGTVGYKSSGNFKASLFIDDDDARSYHSDLAITLSPHGGKVPLKVIVTPSAARRAIQFSSTRDFESTIDFLRSLCNEEGIDYHGNELHELKQLCPAFHLFNTRYNFSLSPDREDGVVEDVFWIEVETYRGRLFQSERYKPEIGGSAL